MFSILCAIVRWIIRPDYHLAPEPSDASAVEPRFVLPMYLVKYRALLAEYSQTLTYEEAQRIALEDARYWQSFRLLVTGEHLYQDGPLISTRQTSTNPREWDRVTRVLVQYDGRVFLIQTRDRALVRSCGTRFGRELYCYVARSARREYEWVTDSVAQMTQAERDVTTRALAEQKQAA